MIEGQLVNLRAPEMDDLDRNTRWINDGEVTRFLSIRYAMSRLAEETWLRDLTSKPMSYTSPFFAIETKEGQHVGNVNLFNVLPEDRSCELGIMIGEKPLWSKGYGSDALRAVLAFAFDEMNLNRVQLHTYAFNERARAVYKKSGFVEEGTLRQVHYTGGKFTDAILMSVLRDEWLR